MRGQIFVRKSSACFAHRLELLLFQIVYRQQVSAICACTLALSVEGTNGNYVDAVTHAVHVVLLQLKPIDAPFRRLINRVVSQRLQHEPLTRAGDRLVQELLHVLLLKLVKIPKSGELDLALGLRERLPQRVAPLFQRSLHERRPVVEHEVKREDADLHLDVFDLDVLASSSAQNLERKDLLGLEVEGNKLAVDDAALHALTQRLSDYLDHVGILLGHVLGVAAVDEDPVPGQDVDLGPLSVVLPLPREAHAREALRHLADALGGLRQHRLHRDPQRDAAGVSQGLGVPALQESPHELVDVRHLAECLPHRRLHRRHGLVQLLLRHLVRTLAGVGHPRRARAVRRREHEGVGQGLHHRWELDADTQLRLERPDDKLCLLLSARNEQLLNLLLLQLLRIFAGRVRYSLHLAEDLLYGQLRRHHEPLLRLGALQGHLP
mmetsp:Transcript_111855/g.303636  ORF Transcript_111855/g.303636 Transcript_111855/m.303636 type:complete len:436 (+) Transcript_111855:476-1783(+)